MGSFEKPQGFSWSWFLDRWELIKLDIYETYGVDLDDGSSHQTRCWHWLLAKISGLLSVPPRQYRPDGQPIRETRLALEAYPYPKTSR